MAYRVQITKCYLVQVVDEEGNEKNCEYVFGDRKEATERGRELKEWLSDEEVRAWHTRSKSIVRL